MDNTNTPEGEKRGKGMWYIAAIAILLLLAWFLWGRGGDVEMMSTDETSPQTLAALFGSGKNVSCEFSHEDPSAGKNSGTVFIANGKMRGDFISMLPDGKSVESHMISDGQTNYIWSSEMKGGQGIKMTVSASEADVATNQKAGQYQAMDWDKDYGYDCDSWSGDGSKFELPSDVTFMDISEMMKGMMPPVTTGAGAGMSGSADGSLEEGSLGDMKAIQCASCDQFPGDQKAQCRTALGC